MVKAFTDLSVDGDTRLKWFYVLLGACFVAYEIILFSFFDEYSGNRTRRFLIFYALQIFGCFYVLYREAKSQKENKFRTAAWLVWLALGGFVWITLPLYETARAIYYPGTKNTKQSLNGAMEIELPTSIMKCHKKIGIVLVLFVLCIHVVALMAAEGDWQQVAVLMGGLLSLPMVIGGVFSESFVTRWVFLIIGFSWAGFTVFMSFTVK